MLPNDPCRLDGCARLAAAPDIQNGAARSTTATTTNDDRVDRLGVRDGAG